VHIPFYELRHRCDDVPAGEVWVHCKSGYRASIGASLLDGAGRDVVHIDDDWEHAAEAGLPIEPG
jgi:hydroxyacylglutathione hydrolase